MSESRAVSPAAHTSDQPAAGRNQPNAYGKEAKLDELSKYFHLPEKAVAKELGICLTSLKKLCRSYGTFRLKVNLCLRTALLRNESYILCACSLAGIFAPLLRYVGITRWPFRKLKSLERTMRKVQSESEVAFSELLCKILYMSMST